MDAQSSRSYSVFTVTMESSLVGIASDVCLQEARATGRSRTSKLNLVDLAGR